ncbi:MAG: LacI family DNA-binding transcriptional regulator [Bacteroidales bacterium]|nr:LacI family DNA-binding transcriptional regulator [Bacteroidales bacterium]
MGKRVKIKEIAEKCGFSNTLVSLVLNDKASLYGIKPETQEKVLFVARQMGYFRDDPAVKSPIRSSSGSLVGMIVHDLNSHFVFEISPLLNKAFSSIGLTFSIVSKNENEQRFASLVKDMKKMYSGLILLGDAADDLTVRTLKESNYPFVVLEKKIVRHRINEIYSDSEEACRLVALHILRLAYKSISIIEQHECSDCIIDTRVLIQTINKIIPDVKISVLKIGGDAILNGPDVNDIVRALRPPLASQMFIVKHSEHVYPLLSFCRTKNIRIPGDVTLLAMDAGIGFGLIDPPVTRVKRKYAQLALKTSQMLWSEIKNNGKGKYKRSVKISPELIVEKSCGTVL